MEQKLSLNRRVRSGPVGGRREQQEAATVETQGVPEICPASYPQSRVRKEKPQEV